MKKISILLFVFSFAINIFSQNEELSFFDQFGALRLETQELADAKGELVTVFHRNDDVVWSRVVYRIIDLRYKQNFPLYYPIQSDDPAHRSLFKVIVDAIVDGNLPIYQKLMDNPRPDFRQAVEKKNIPSLFLIDDPTVDYSNDPTHYDVEKSDAMIINYNKKKNKLNFNFYSYESVVRNQVKYLIQEVIFFDQRLSRLYSKIIAIAPMNLDKITVTEREDAMKALNQSIMFWVSYDQLRPFLAQQYLLNEDNDTKRLTFEEFFLKRLYSSYILGQDDINNKMILDYTQDEEEVRKQQRHIEEELLTFEQDLWEY